MAKKIKVAILSSNDITSDPRITRSISFLQKKYQVGVFCFVWPYIGQALYQKEKNLEIFRFRYRGLPLSSWYKKIFSYPATPTGSKIKPTKAKTSKTVGQISYLYNFYFANRKLAEAAIKFKPDIVHANDFDTLWAGHLIKKATGAKLIYDAHEIWSRQGQNLPRWILKIFEKTEKQLLGKIDGFITVNDSIKRELSRYYHHRFDVPSAIIYNAPKYQQLKKIDNFKNFKNKTVIFYHGGYMANRGLEELILAAKYLKYPAAIVLRLTSVPDKIKSLIKDDKIILVSPVAMKEMVRKSLGAEIGVVSYKPTNINNRLSLPNKVFEYQMAGMALAVSDLPELRNIITKYKNGLTFNPNDPKDIAKKLNWLMEDKKRLSKMRQNSLLAAKIFNWENEEKKLEKLYEAILKKN